MVMRELLSSFRCPDCDSSDIDISRENYHPDGADIVDCEGCGHTFQVSYKIDTVKRIKTPRDTEDV